MNVSECMFDVEGGQFQTLLGVTGSGKTFTMANVVAQLNKPTLIISHNKTLAAQLYGELAVIRCYRIAGSGSCNNCNNHVMGEKYGKNY